MKQETIAGVTLQQTYKPNIAASEYPVLDTKPLSSVVSSSNAHPDKLRLILLKEQDLVGLEDDPDFWNMNIDSGEVTDSPPKKENKTAGTFGPNPYATCALSSGLRYHTKELQIHLSGGCKRLGLRSCVPRSQTSPK